MKDADGRLMLQQVLREVCLCLVCSCVLCVAAARQR